MAEGPSDAGDPTGNAASVEGAVTVSPAGTSRRPLPDLQAVGTSVIDGIHLLAAHQAAITRQEEALAARQEAADQRENLLAAQSAELLERAELLASRETAVAQREKDLAATTAELDAARTRTGELVLREREHCKMLEEILRRQQGRLMELGFSREDFRSPLEQTVGHLAMAFDRHTDLLERLPARITARLNAEGRSVSVATAEYVLACYRSRDAGFPVEPALEGILRESEEAAAAVKLEVNPAARQVAEMFAAEEEEVPSPGDQAGPSGVNPEASPSSEASSE